MYKFERFGILLIQVDAGNARIVHLLKELFQIRPPLMIHPCVGKETTGIARFENTDAEIDVFAEPHPGKTSQLPVDFSTNTHIKAAGIEFIHLLFPAADTACGKKRRHRIIDGFLDVGKRFVGAVGTAESIGRLTCQFPLHRFEESFGQNDIGIQNNQIIAATPLRSVIAGLPGRN